MAARGKYILVYTAGLFVSPFALVASKPGTPVFLSACVASGLILALTALPLFRLEWSSPSRSLLRNKLVAATMITGGFGLFLAFTAIIWFLR